MRLKKKIGEILILVVVLVCLYHSRNGLALPFTKPPNSEKVIHINKTIHYLFMPFDITSGSEALFYHDEDGFGQISFERTLECAGTHPDFNNEGEMQLLLTRGDQGCEEFWLWARDLPKVISKLQELQKQIADNHFDIGPK
jgi:hypothetical protein